MKNKLKNRLIDWIKSDNKAKNWLEKWIDNDSNQAKTKEKTVIYYKERKNRNYIDVLINYCSDKNLKVVEVYSIATCSKKGSKKSLFDMLSFINSQKDRIHIVCNDFYDIFQDIGDLQILEPFITMGKITIHIIKQNFIIDKNSYNADIIKRDNIMLLTRYSYISTLSHNIRVAKNHKKSISKS